jgi:Domain of unknown function (DUF4388)
MSFTGDLEHLPIVDVIQLLHATRKSGVLRVKSRKGESQLVFKDGYMVSANHLNNSVRIGKILVDLNVITPEVLDQALETQKNAGHGRMPLIVTLIELGLVQEDEVYKGLEQLIELTIVEILTWKKGTFILDVQPPQVADEYRYYPEKMKQEINVDTQSILMDSLRIYDEKMRDGQLTEEEWEDDPLTEVAGPETEGPALSADDLGLADLDQLERKISEPHTCLEEFDPCAIPRQKIQEAAPGLSAAGQEELVSYLGECAAAAAERGARPNGPARSVIFFSSDELFSYVVTTACKPTGILVFATNEEQDLDPIIGQALAKNSVPLLVFDAPAQSGTGFSAEQITSLRQQKQAKYPRVRTIQLAPSGDTAFSLHAYRDGARAVIPRPFWEERPEAFAADIILFLEGFQASLKDCETGRYNPLVGRLATCISRLHGLREIPEAALALLEFVAEICERSLTLIVREAELIAEKGIGVKAAKGEGISPALGFRIPLAQPSLFRTAVETGEVYYGTTDDAAVREHLFAVIGAPCRSTVLLLPMKCRGKTLFLTYGDFGSKEPSPVEIDLLKILASQAGLVLENSLLRKKLEQPPR